VDLINDAVKNQNKQVIFSTHSFNILSPFYNDCGREANRVKRGEKHVRADPQKFSLYTFEKTSGQVSIARYPICEKNFTEFKNDFKQIWG
jgi:predicted ATP-dependent endonuclease of OLD family